MPPKIAHIINPFFASDGSRLKFIQQVTYRTMQIAKNFVTPELDVEFLAVQYAEDRDIAPADFLKSSNLQRSVLNCGEFVMPRKLPLLGDILATAAANSLAEYFVYTNVDIGIMPYFYQSVATYITQGHDAFTINRRTISDHYQDLSDIPLMYAESGQPHRGWDCFVFQRQAISNFILGTVCVGVPPVGLALISNLIALSKNFRQYTQEHLTFHLGNDRAWNNTPFREYANHNQHQVLQILNELNGNYGGFSRNSPPGRFLFFHSNPFFAYLYSSWMKLYIPAKVTRKIQ